MVYTTSEYKRMVKFGIGRSEQERGRELWRRVKKRHG